MWSDECGQRPKPVWQPAHCRQDWSPKPGTPDPERGQGAQQETEEYSEDAQSKKHRQTLGQTQFEIEQCNSSGKGTPGAQYVVACGAPREENTNFCERNKMEEAGGNVLLPKDYLGGFLLANHMI